jgi:hypothetical protein
MAASVSKTCCCRDLAPAGHPEAALDVIDFAGAEPVLPLSFRSRQPRRKRPRVAVRVSVIRGARRPTVVRSGIRLGRRKAPRILPMKIGTWPAKEWWPILADVRGRTKAPAVARRGLFACAHLAYLGHIMLSRPRIPPAGFIAPCLPTKTECPPSGELWLHEIKHDGFRVIARKDGAKVRLYSRPGNDLRRRRGGRSSYPDAVRARPRPSLLPAALPGRRFTLVYRRRDRGGPIRPPLGAGAAKNRALENLLPFPAAPGIPADSAQPAASRGEAVRPIEPGARVEPHAPVA